MIPSGRKSTTSNLAADVSSFIGRRRETTEVKKLLSASRLVTLTGVGGVGKTRLALRVAADVRRSFPDGVWLVEFSKLQDATLMAQTVADALGIRDQSGRDPLVILRDYLSDRHLLLVLDNCEHLLGGSASLAFALLTSAPRLRILATSREALLVSGERVFVVPPLSLPDPDSLQRPGSAGQYEAVRLFMERAEAVIPGFALTEENCVTVARLCHRLDGIPLAIELAAVRVRAFSVEEILGRLNAFDRLPVRQDTTVVPRHRTLQALLDWSYGLCSEQERILWARVSVFAGGLDLEAAEHVCSGNGVRREEVFALIAGLIDKSILLREERGGAVRYRLLETIRQYGRNRLAESAAEETMQVRHRDWYQATAVRAEASWFGPDQTGWFARLQDDRANLRVALDYCLTKPGEAETGCVLATDLWFFWIASGSLGEGRHWLDRALQLALTPSQARGKALWANSYLSLLLNDIPRARELLEECRALADQLGCPSILPYVSQASGLAALFEYELSSSLAYGEEAVSGLRVAGDPTCLGLTFIQLALSLSLLGEGDQAVRVCEDALARSEVCGEHWIRSYVLWVLSIEVWRQGDRRRAVMLAREGIRLKSGFNDLFGIALCVEAVAWIAADDEQSERAAQLLGAVQAMWRTIGVRSSSWFTHLTAFRERCREQVSRALGEAAFEAAVVNGAELPTDQAIRLALGKSADTSTPSAGQAPPMTPLTPRETQIAELVAKGLTNKDIAAALVISIRTAEGHVEHILSKMGFTSRAQVAAWITEQR